MLHVCDGAGASDGFDATDPGSDTRFLRDHKRPDVSGGPHMGASTQLGREAVDLDDAHFVAVFFAEEGHRAALDGVLGVFHVGHDRRVPEDLLIHDAFNGEPFVGCEGGKVREVEAEAIRRHERSCLTHMCPERLPKRGMQQVRRRVIAAGGITQGVVHDGRDGLANRQRGGRLHAVCSDAARHQPAHAGHGRHGRSTGLKASVVRDLTTGLHIKRGPVENRESVEAGGQHIELRPGGIKQRHDLCICGGRRVSLEHIRQPFQLLLRGGR